MIYLPEHLGICKGFSKTLDVIYEIYEREINKEK